MPVVTVKSDVLQLRGQQTKLLLLLKATFLHLFANLFLSVSKSV